MPRYKQTQQPASAPTQLVEMALNSPHRDWRYLGERLAAGNTIHVYGLALQRLTRSTEWLPSMRYAIDPDGTTTRAPVRTLTPEDGASRC